MLIFHRFLQYNMHVRLLHTLSKLKLARARRGLKHIQKMSIHGGQKIEKIYENVPKVDTESKKPLPKQIFTNFGLILESPGGLKMTKNGKKNKAKK